MDRESENEMEEEWQKESEVRMILYRVFASSCAQRSGHQLQAAAGGNWFEPEGFCFFGVFDKNWTIITSRKIIIFKRIAEGF